MNNESERRHRLFHDGVASGLKLDALASDNVLVQLRDYRIMIVKPDAPSPQRKRLDLLAAIAKKEMNADSASYHSYDGDLVSNSVHGFLLCVNGRAAAFAVLCKSDSTDERVDWRQVHNSSQNSSCSVRRWTVRFIWVHPKFRRKKYAHALMKNMAKFAKTSPNNLAHQRILTREGEALVRSLSPRGIFLTCDNDF